jgi:hypothetical protein
MTEECSNAHSNMSPISTLLAQLPIIYLAIIDLFFQTGNYLTQEGRIYREKKEDLNYRTT